VAFVTASGAGTNFRVGGTGQTSGAKQFFVVPLHFFGSKVQLVVLVSAFMMASTVWSVSCLLFFYSRCPPPCLAICKSGGVCAPPCPMESAPLMTAAMGAICSTTVPVGTRLRWSTDSPACMGRLRRDGRCCGREAQCGQQPKINWTKTAHNTLACGKATAVRTNRTDL